MSKNQLPISITECNNRVFQRIPPLPSLASSSNQAKDRKFILKVIVILKRFLLDHNDSTMLVSLHLKFDQRLNDTQYLYLVLVLQLTRHMKKNLNAHQLIRCLNLKNDILLASANKRAYYLFQNYYFSCVKFNEIIQ